MDDFCASRMIGEAALVAAHAHAHQRREDRGDAYLVHLAEVAAMCGSLEPFDPVLVAAAWLHDTVEDAGLDADFLRGRFGPDVAHLVMDVTDPPGLSGKARRRRQVEHAAKAGIRVKRLKIADKTSNVEELVDLDPRSDPRGDARYLRWARRVVEVCRGAAPPLERRFDESAALLESRLAKAGIDARKTH